MLWAGADLLAGFGVLAGLFCHVQALTARWPAIASFCPASSMRIQRIDEGGCSVARAGNRRALNRGFPLVENLAGLAGLVAVIAGLDLVSRLGASHGGRMWPRSMMS